MATTVDRDYSNALHPVHAILIAGAAPLFLGAMLSDLAYASSYQVQWTNFASWLIVGGLVLSGFALLWACINLLRADRQDKQMPLFLLLLGTWVVGFINALVHAKDVWASMPAGLILSVIGAALAIAATWIGFSTRPAGASA